MIGPGADAMLQSAAPLMDNELGYQRRSGKANSNSASIMPFAHRDNTYLALCMPSCQLGVAVAPVLRQPYT